MKMLKRTLALMLALIMMFSAVPFNAYATESTDEPSVPTEAPVDAPESEEPEVEDEIVEDPVVDEPADDEEVVEAPQSRAVPTSSNVEYKYNVVHLDAGRKYFSVDNIKAIIDNIYAAGFNQLNLYLSDNQGFRFALDDMTLTTDYGTYDLTPALGDGYSSSDNKAPDGTGMYLTQSEMDEIITYAHSKGIDIVPAINVPGHMGAILEEFTSFRYSSSKSSIDLDNDEAVAFALALTEKYAAYFASKGCKYYCVGADEYANDLSSMGFEGMGADLYTKFVQFLNDAADIVIAKGMTPRAFNDGFYYKDYSISTEPNKAYEVYYWSSGWNGYDVATAATISTKGHQMINTNGSYYWILGGTKCTESTAKQFSTTYFQNSTVSDPAGSMFCIWCDVGDDDSSENVITDTAPVIAAFGSVLPEVEALVSGVITPDPEPEVPEDVGQPDAATGIVVTAPGLTGLTVAEATAPAIEGAAEGKVLAWDMTPATAEGKYEGEATVAVPVPEGWDSSKMGAFVIEADNSVKLIDGAVNADGNFEFTMPHFSVGGVYEVAPTAADTDLTLEINGVQEYTLDGHVGTEGTYTTEDGVVSYTVKHNTVTTEGSTTTTKATTLSNGEYIIGNGTQWLTLNGTILGSTTNASAATKWTVTSSTTNGYTIRSGNNYLTWTSSTSSFWVTTTYTYQLAVDTEAQTWTYSGNSGFYSYLISSSSYMGNSSNNYFLRFNNGWKFETTNSSNGAAYTVTTTTGSTSTSTTVTINGVKAGSTTVSVGSNVYNVTVNKGAYSATVTVGAYKTYTDSSSTVTVEDPSVATATLKDGILTITGIKVGTTTVTTDNAVYTITVSELDLSSVDPLYLETWVTNKQLNTSGTSSATGQKNEDNSSYSYYRKAIKADDEGVYSEAGVAIASLVDSAYSESDSLNYVYWRARYLTETKQDTSKGNNQTAAGDSAVRIRFWNGEWQYQNDAGTWKATGNVTGGSLPQLVAYYLQKTEVTDEVTTLVVDFGIVPHTDYNSSAFVLIDYAVKYQSGTVVPNEFPTSKTMAFHCDSNDTNTVHRASNGSYYRQIGMISALETPEYEVYMITATPSSNTATNQVASNCTRATDYEYAGTEKVIWVDDEANLGAFASDDLKYSSISGTYGYSVGGEPLVSGIEIYKNQGMLITYYVRAKKTDDSLTVVYYDEKFGDTLFSYNVNVTNGVTFAAITPEPSTFLNNANRIDVTGCGIVNTKGKLEGFETDLTKVPEAVGKYHSELYTYTGSEIKDNGKTLYLYYNINAKTLSPNFVADFGLPIQFSLTDVVSEGQEALVQSVTVNEKTRYGTLEYDALTKTFTYTPTTILQNIDVLTINIKFSTATAVSTTNVGVTPATTVYYGEKFINFGTGWTTEGTPSPAGNQATEVLGNSSYYGYDTAYNKLGASDGTSKKATAIGSSATFEFTGTGIQVFANATESSGYASVTVKNKATGKTVKMAMVDTVVNGTEDTETTGGQSGNLAGLPIVSLVDLANIPYATYTVTISKVMDTDPIYIDGIRVFDSINAATKDENNIYFADKEDCPDFYELRDVVLKALNIQISESADYETMYQQLYDASVGTHASAIVTTSGSIDYTATDNKDARQDLLDNGPKNELYLFPGDTLTFNVSSTARIMQLGMKAPNTAVDAEVTITAVDAEVTIGKTTTKYDIDSSVDMFYKIQDAAKKATNYTVQVKNASDSGILSVTLLKICDDPSFAFAPLTEDNIKAILADAGYTEETPDVPDVPETPVEPGVPEETIKPTEPEVEETTKPSKPNKPSKPEKPGKPENTKPTEPEVEETTKPSKPSKPGKPENTKPTEPQKPGKPGNNGNQKPGKPGKDEEKTYTLKITFVNLFGKKVGTATITTTNGVVSASQIAGKAPARYKALWFIPVTLRANGNTSIVVPVL